MGGRGGGRKRLHEETLPSAAAAAAAGARRSEEPEQHGHADDGKGEGPTAIRARVAIGERMSERLAEKLYGIKKPDPPSPPRQPSPPLLPDGYPGSSMFKRGPGRPPKFRPMGAPENGGLGVGTQMPPTAGAASVDPNAPPVKRRPGRPRKRPLPPPPEAAPPAPSAFLPADSLYGGPLDRGIARHLNEDGTLKSPFAADPLLDGMDTPRVLDLPLPALEDALGGLPLDTPTIAALRGKDLIEPLIRSPGSGRGLMAGMGLDTNGLLTSPLMHRDPHLSGLGLSPLGKQRVYPSHHQQQGAGNLMVVGVGAKRAVEAYLNARSPKTSDVGFTYRSSDERIKSMEEQLTEVEKQHGGNSAMHGAALLLLSRAYLHEVGRGAAAAA